MACVFKREKALPREIWIFFNVCRQIIAEAKLF